MSSAVWQAVTWNIARAGGFTAYALLSLAVIVGLALSSQMQSSSRWPRLINNEMHNFLSLLGTVFVVIHILAVWLDPFTHFGWSEVLIPFVTQYHPLWMSLGIVAVYLGLAVGISTLLRPRIGYKWWRRIHIITFATYVFATLHGIGTGTDSLTLWALGMYLVSTLAVGALLCRRLLVPIGKQGRSHPILAGLAMLSIVGIALWLILPLYVG